MTSKRFLRAPWGVLLLLFLALPVFGGCGGGGGDGGKKSVALLSAKILGTEADAGGYIDIEVGLFSDEEGETNNLSLLLYGSGENNGEDGGEKLLAWGDAGFLETGERSYRRKLKVSVSDESGAAIASGKYGSLRAVLFAGSTFARAVGDSEAQAGGAVDFLSIDDAPALVRGSLVATIKETPAFDGMEDAGRRARSLNGWTVMEAGRVDGSSAVVGYTANVDLNVELACEPGSLEAIEIRETGTSGPRKVEFVLPDGSTSDIYLWKGPFSTSERGVTFDVMIWSDGSAEDTPPHVSKLAFDVIPVPASDSSASSAKFASARGVRDETLRPDAFSPPARAAADTKKLSYKEFAARVWAMWKRFEIDERTWDTSDAAAYWYASLPGNLEMAVDWNDAVAAEPALAGKSRKADFFGGIRPINYGNSSYGRSQALRPPKVYTDALDGYNALAMNTARVPYPYGDYAYVHWWLSLPQWMIESALFPVPARRLSSGAAIGDSAGDEGFWALVSDAAAIVLSYGTDSAQYADFYYNKAGAYQNRFPATAAPNPSEPGNLPVAAIDPSNVTTPVKFQYGDDYIRYTNGMTYSEGFNRNYNGKYGFGAEFYLKYENEARFDVGRDILNVGSGSARRDELSGLNRNMIGAGANAYLLGKKASILEAEASFNSEVSAELRRNADMTFDSWTQNNYIENESYASVVVKLFGKAFISERIDFQDGGRGSLADLADKFYLFDGFSFSKPIVDPDVANVVIYGIKISFNVSAEGEVGVDFSYKRGTLADADSDSIGNLSPEGGIRFEFTPFVDLSAYTSVAVSDPLPYSLNVLRLELGSNLKLIELRTPFWYERGMRFRDEMVRLMDEGPIADPNGDCYYALLSRGGYGWDLVITTLDGSLVLKVLVGMEFPFTLFQWSGLRYDYNIFESRYLLPLSLPVEAQP